MLAGKTIFITGASRGIGKAIALKAAKDGANIIIAAKTTTPHPKLPGTIYTAAKEGIRLWVYSIACRNFIQLNLHISNIHILNSVVLWKWFWTKVPNTFYGACQIIRYLKVCFFPSHKVWDSEIWLYVSSEKILMPVCP